MINNVSPPSKEEKPKRIWISPRRKRHSLTDWFMMTEAEVQNEFLSLPNAKKIGEGDKSFVYVPGTREDRALLVSHSDTVWGDEDKIQVGYSAGIYGSLKKGTGIGADDRAGCAILWKLRELGHSLLIPNAEESGCVGSRFLMQQEEWSKEINNHRFAIEFDRMNDRDLVCYSVGSEKFKDFLESKLQGYKRAFGSFTDICILCDKMAGVNISIGYYNQHSSNEILIDSEWNRTLSKVRSFLQEKDFPRFDQDPKPDYSKYKNDYSKSYGYSNNYGNSRSYDPYNSNDNYFKSSVPLKIMNAKADDKFLSTSNLLCDTILVCPHCDFVQDQGEYEANNKSCVYEECNKTF